MGNWKKWIWPGILTCAILSLLAVYTKAPVIEADLAAKAATALESEGNSWAEVEMDGRDATLLGSAPSEEARTQALEITLATSAIRIVSNNTELIAAQSPYTVTAKKNGATLELIGFVPSETMRSTVVAAAVSLMPNVKINDTMALARGAPDNYEAMVEFGLDQIVGLDAAQFSLNGIEMSIRGKAPSIAARDDFTKLLNSNLPSGMTLARTDISAPQVSPYVWSAKLQDNVVTLTGYVPSDEVKGSILNAVGSTLPDVRIVDNQRLASGAPDKFTDISRFILEQLPHFKNSEISLSNLNLSVSGIANSPENHAAIMSALEKGVAQQGVKLTESNITPATVNPYVWSATVDKDVLTLAGSVPDASTRNAIWGKVKAILPGARVIDSQQLALGAPGSFDLVVFHGLEQVARFSSGSVNISDNKYTINGVAKSVSDYEKATTSLDKLPSTFNRGQGNIVPATVSPFTWGAGIDGASVKLTGFIGGEDERRTIIAAVKIALPVAEISDEMRVALGAPEGFLTGTRLAADQLANLSVGSLRLSDKAFVIQGRAKSPDTYEMAKAAISNTLPHGLTLANDGIEPAIVSPYEWRASLDEKNVELTGFVPNEDVRKQILSMTKSTFPSVTAVDSLQIADGAPKEFVAATVSSLKRLSSLSVGMISLKNQAITIEGTAKNPQSFARASDPLKTTFPSGWIIQKDQVSPPTIIPFIWSARYDGKVVVLDGYVPAEPVRMALLAEIKKRLPGVKINDQMLVAAGAPELFEKATTGAIALLPKFSSGDVSLNRLNLAVKGTGKSSASYLAAENIVNGYLDGRITVASAEIAPPVHQGDYNWTAQKRGSYIVLSGLVPSKADRLRIAKRAAALNPGVGIINRMTIELGAPRGFIPNTNKGLSLMNGIANGAVTISNEILSIAGTARSVDAFEITENAIAGKLAAGFVWGTRDVQPAVISPYNWSIERGGEQVVLGGFVPSLGLGKVNAAAAGAVFNKSISDRQRIAVGQPDGFGNAVAGLMTGVSALDNSRGTITGTSVFVQGRAQSEAEANQIGDSIAASLPSNFKLRKLISYPVPEPKETVEVLAVPNPNPEPETEPVVKPEQAVGPEVKAEETVEAAPEPEADVASETESQIETVPEPAVVAEAGSVPKQELQVEPVVIPEQDAETKPEPNVAKKAEVAIAAKPESEPDVDVSTEPGSQVEVKTEPAVQSGKMVEAKPAPQAGEPIDLEQKGQIEAEPPTKSTTAHEVEGATEPQQKVCTVDFEALFKGEKIKFDTARAVIRPESYPLLDRIVVGLRECKNSRIEVGGHTDSRGSVAYNQSLSEARARAVVDHLIRKAGVVGQNLSAKGYGEVQPLVPNRLASDFTKNRRIEFKLLSNN